MSVAEVICYIYVLVQKHADNYIPILLWRLSRLSNPCWETCCRAKKPQRGKKKQLSGICFSTTLQSRLCPPDGPVQTEMPRARATPLSSADLVQNCSNHPACPMLSPLQTNPLPACQYPSAPASSMEESHHVSTLSPAEETDSDA